MRSKFIVHMITFIILLAFIPLSPTLAGPENNMPVRLHFVNAIDANVYTERLVYEICLRLGLDVSITLEEMNIGLEGVNAGIFDGICNQTLGIEEDYDQLIAVPVETAVCKFYALTMQQDPFLCGTWDGLNGKRVGSLSGQPLIAGALPQDIAAYIEKPSMSHVYEALRTGECEVVIVDDASDKGLDPLVLPSDIRIAGVVDTRSGRIFLHKKHAALAERFAAVLLDMERDGSLARIKAMKPLESRNEKVVLYLSSYSAEMEWEQQLVYGIGNVLDRHTDIIFHTIALNAYRNTDTSLLEATALKSIAVDFLHSPPDAVIVSDNEAMAFLLNNYNAILPGDIPVVTCGVSSGPMFDAQRVDLYPNIVGVEEGISAAETVAEMLRLFPDTEQIFVINDDTLTGRRWKSDIQEQLEAYQGRVQINYNENLPLDGLLAQVSALDAHTLVLCGTYYLDRDDWYYPQATFQSLLYEASPVPVFGLLDTSQSYGPLGGRYADAVMLGETAANTVVGILHTGQIGEVHNIDTAQSNRWIFNWNIMQEYGIPKGRIPADAILLNKETTLQETNPVLFYSIIVGSIAFAVIILLLSIFTLLLQKRNRHLVLAEADLRTSHDEMESVKTHLQTILETAPIAYSLLVDDVVVESNGYYKEHIGSAPGQKNIEKYDRQDRYARLTAECLEKGFVGNIHWHVTKANGEKVRYLYNIARSEYGGQEAIVMWGVNIEQLERQKDALDRAYRDLQGLIESVPVPIVLLLPGEKRFADANPAWRKLFAVPDTADMSSLTWDSVGAFASKSIDDLIQRAMAANHTISEEWEFVNKAGETIEAIIFLRKIVFGGKDCLLVTHQDLSAERARERMLENAAEKEREANRLKSHFLMNVSHEIRTPLNAIIGITRLAKPQDEAGKLYGSMLQIGQSTSVLLHIINDVLDLSMMEDGKMVLKPEEVKLSQLISDLDAVIAVDMEKKHIERSVDLEGVAHDTLLVDPSRLQQVLMILTSNAVKFTPEGGHISLTVREAESPDHLSTFQFTVRDTGIGIEPGKTSRLFKPFEQGDDSITRQYGGAGLGLSVAKNIVELMGGEIWVESEVGKGSAFSFTIQVPVLPLGAETTVPPADTPPEARDTEETELSGLRILLVDDVELNRMVAAEMLGAMGCITEEAENGRQAVDMVAKATPGYYDLVFMDVQMPVLDGCSATKEIRALEVPGAATLPIVAMTANVMPDDIRMVVDAGMNGYVGKPVFPEQIMEAIRAHVRWGNR